MSSLLIPLTLGFLGSFHCIGMCGPIALALPIGKWDNAKKIIGILLYNGGRVLTYSLIGLLFGMIGKGFSMVGLQQWVSITLGIAIITIVLLPGRVTARLDTVTQQLPYISSVKRNIALLFKQRTLSALALIGMLNGLLPCGFVYMAVAGAIASAGAVNGALFMALFGLGTVPAMFLVAFSSQLFPVSVRTQIRRAVPILMFAMGATLIIRGMNLGIPYMSPKFDTKGQVTRSCCQRAHHRI